MPIAVSVTESKVVMDFELAWKARWAMISWENSVEMSTFESSRAESLMVPREPLPAVPIEAVPLDDDTL